MADIEEARSVVNKSPIITVPSDVALLTKRFHRFLKLERERPLDSNRSERAVMYKQQAVRYHTMLLQLVDLQHKHRLEIAKTEACRELEKLGADLKSAYNIYTCAQPLTEMLDRAIKFEYGDGLVEFLLMFKFAYDANLAQLLIIFVRSLTSHDGDDQHRLPLEGHGFKRLIEGPEPAQSGVGITDDINELQYEKEAAENHHGKKDDTPIELTSDELTHLFSLLEAISRTLVGAEALFKCGYLECIFDRLPSELRNADDNEITPAALSMMTTLCNIFDRVHKYLYNLNDAFIGWLWEVAKRYEKFPVGKSENEKKFADALFKCIIIYASDGSTRTKYHGKMFLENAHSLRAAKRSGGWIAERLARMTAGMLDGLQCLEVASEYLESGMFDFAIEEFSKQRGKNWLGDLVSGFSWILKLLVHSRDEAAKALKPMRKPGFQRKVFNLRNVYKEIAEKKRDENIDDDDPELFDSELEGLLWKIPRNTQAWLDDLRKKYGKEEREEEKREQARQRQLKCELLLLWLFVLGVEDHGVIEKQALVDSMLEYRESIIGTLERGASAYQMNNNTEAEYRRMMEARAKCERVGLLDIALNKARELTQLNTILGLPLDLNLSIPKEYLDIPTQLALWQNEAIELEKSLKEIKL